MKPELVLEVPGSLGPLLHMHRSGPCMKTSALSAFCCLKPSGSLNVCAVVHPEWQVLRYSLFQAIPYGMAT